MSYVHTNTLHQLVFLPNLTGQPSFNDNECELFALPARLGGLGIVDPSQYSMFQFSTPVAITAPWFSQFFSSPLSPLLMFCLFNWRLRGMLLMAVVSLSLTFMPLC